MSVQTNSQNEVESMIWGMPTLVEFRNMKENVQLCRRLGLDFVEINMNLPMFQHDMLEEAAVQAKKSGVGVTVHLDENFAPADFNPLIVKAHLQTLQRTLRTAKKVGIPIVNMHLSKGVYFTLPEEKVYLFERYKDDFMCRIADLRDMCEKELCGSDVRICIENTGGYLSFQKDAIDLLLESDVFSLTLDIGHLHNGKIDDGPFIFARRDRLSHFHIHDANKSGDHLALGCGEINLEEMLSMADCCRARCVVETKTADALEDSVRWLKEHGWMQNCEI